jgi:hypothetical protein
VPPDQKQRSGCVRATWIGLVLVIALAIADAALAPAPAPEQLDFIDTLLASRAVVVAIRIAIVFAALFLILSVIALAAQRRWLARLGPVEVSTLDAENQQLKEELASADGLIEDLEAKAAYTEQLVDKG